MIIDDRENASHVIRTKGRCRRTNKVLFHLFKLPFKDSDDHFVTIDRRTEDDRRNLLIKH